MKRWLERILIVAICNLVTTVTGMTVDKVVAKDVLYYDAET